MNSDGDGQYRVAGCGVLYEMMLLDAVQKGKRITAEAAKLLRKQALVEGRLPNLYVSADVAQVTGQQAEYVKNRGFDDEHYMEMLKNYLGKFSAATPVQVKQLWMMKLPDVLSEKQKHNKIRNLLQKMQGDGLISNIGGRGSSARWDLKN